VPFTVKLSVPGKAPTPASASRPPATVYRLPSTVYRTDFPEIIHRCELGRTWTADQLEAVTGGKWLVKPPEGWFVRSVVAGISHIDKVEGPTVYAAHTRMDRHRHEQYSDVSKVLNNNWD